MNFTNIGSEAIAIACNPGKWGGDCSMSCSAGCEGYPDARCDQLNGYCVSCISGWYGRDCATAICRYPRCHHGTCVAPGTCQCQENYIMNDGRCSRIKEPGELCYDGDMCKDGSTCPTDGFCDKVPFQHTGWVIGVVLLSILVFISMVICKWMQKRQLNRAHAARAAAVPSQALQYPTGQQPLPPYQQPMLPYGQQPMAPGQQPASAYGYQPMVPGQQPVAGYGQQPMVPGQQPMAGYGQQPIAPGQQIHYGPPPPSFPQHGAQQQSMQQYEQQQPPPKYNNLAAAQQGPHAVYNAQPSVPTAAAADSSVEVKTSS